LYDQRQYLVHTLSIAKFVIVFCPQIQNVAQILLDVFSGEEFYVLHGPIDVLLYEVPQFLLLVHKLDVGIIIVCVLTLGRQHLNIEERLKILVVFDLLPFEFQHHFEFLVVAFALVNQGVNPQLLINDRWQYTQTYFPTKTPTARKSYE